MISRLRRFGIAAALGLVAALGLSFLANVPAVLAAPGEKVVVTTKPVSTITRQEDLANIGDDVITIKNGATTLGTQKVKPSIVDGKLAYVANFDGIQPGNPLTACSEKAAACVDFEKKAGEDRTVQIQGKNPSIDKPGAEEEKTCSTGTGLSGALAWVLCPLTQLMVNATGFIERNLIIPYLTVSPLQTGDNPVYRLWESMRNIANVLFIVAFFIVIFSQATSIGLSNYGIKRLLPRLAMVAIGTNLSYFIVAFAIDAFNVFGAGISQLVMTAINAGATGGGADPSAGSIFAVSAIAGVGVTIAAAVTSGGAVIGWLFSIIGIAFLILLVAVIVLILRQMIILLLVVVSPLAFVAWLLPNTERYFTRWRGMLIQLLMMYPLIVLLFATGKIFQRLIVSYDFDLVAKASQGMGDMMGPFAAAMPLIWLAQASGVTEQSAEVVKVVMGFFAGAVPLIALPATFAASGSIMGKLYNGIQNRGRAWSKAGAEKAGERLKPWMDEKKMQMARSNSRTLRAVGGARVMRREAKRQSRMAEYERAKAEWLAGQATDNKRFARQSAGIGGQEGVTRVMARGVAVAEKAEKENLDNEMALLSRQLRSLNIDQKNFAGGHLRKYLENPRTNDVLRDSSGNAIKDEHGREFRFSQNPGLMRAALNSAAAQGEVATIEAARQSSGAVAGLSTGEFQRTVDQVIRNNDGKLKEKGGYHLATDFALAAGRNLADPVDATGAAVSPPSASGDQMVAARVKAMASSGAASIAGMKAGLLGGTSGDLAIAAQAPTPITPGMNAQQIKDATDFNNRRNAVLNQLSQTDTDGITFGAKLRERMTQITSNPNTLNATEAPDAIRQMEADLRASGF